MTPPAARPAPSLHTQDGARAVVDHLRLIPDRYRTFGLTPADIRTRFGLGEPYLRILDAGALHRTGPDGGARYDEIDVLNLSIQLNAGSTAAMLRRMLPRSLARAGYARFEVTSLLTCPDPGHEGPCRYVLETDAERHETERHEHRPATFLSAVTVVERRPKIPADVVQVAQDIAGYDFYMLPPDLKAELHFIERTGMADCFGTADLFVNRVRRAGLRVRASFGLLLVPPFGTYHRFPEVLLEGEWVGFDPLLLGALARWGSVPATEWPPHRPISAAVVRLGDTVPVATHNGEPVAPSFPLRQLADEPPPGGPEVS
jgi:hypothetical protein